MLIGTRCRLSALAAALVFGLVSAIVPAATAGAQTDSALTNTAIARLFDRSMPALSSRSKAPSITGNRAFDQRIVDIAVSRGYQFRGSPLDALGRYQGFRLQRSAIDDLVAMQEAMADEAGVTLQLTSAYRSVSRQRTLFLGRLDGRSDAAINQTLTLAAPPGFSKHHTGYAIDVSSQGLAGPAFRQSTAWAWLTENTYENAMRFGWIPSYPDGASGQGPEPEPWEWVWIGRDAAACGRTQDCAVGGLDEVRKRSGRVTGWAATADGTEPSSLRLVTAKRTRVLEPTVQGRHDLNLVFGTVAMWGFRARTNVPKKARWACLEARAVAGGPWSRVGCLDLR